MGGRVGLGDRPAVLVVDLQYGFTEETSPLGGNLDEVIAATASLLSGARRIGLPVAFTAVTFQQSHLERLVWLRKMPGLASLIEGSRWCDIDERVKPEPGEPVFGKQAASAFFGTSLISFLLGASVDSLIVTGCVTSGCVRASVVDAVSWGFRTIVPAECVGDRAAGPHDSNIFDMDSKYADVEPLETVMARLNAFASELAEAPAAS
ncbi:MAG: isochorismatase family protein [Solirubrobacterales bacterium]|nr:isochorismatase family protein [Solirubrobacterales bacterium]MBV9164606.1 isochorismatase family protein [Solirubrobacterales bacterium]MBV9537141.1 isochorismatase family protein [Solirubrobacterales bacterium]